MNYAQVTPDEITISILAKLLLGLDNTATINDDGSVTLDLHATSTGAIERLSERSALVMMITGAAERLR